MIYDLASLRALNYALWQTVATGAATEAASCENLTKKYALNMSDTTEYTSCRICEKNCKKKTIWLCLNEFEISSRVADVARAALTERSGSSTKGRTPNIRYFVAKLSIYDLHAF